MLVAKPSRLHPPGSAVTAWPDGFPPRPAVLITVAVTVAALITACGTAKPPASSSSAAPAPAGRPPTCGNPEAIVAGLSARDKLAQLLMVGVRDAADAKTVVADHHVGGIFIGSWTDLSMLSDGSLRAITGSAGPLPLAVSVDEEGGRCRGRRRHRTGRRGGVPHR
ncbi:hypothetical protein H7I76_37935, partial [Mycolicibacterium vaccae]|nr:hypothetical protein [Mycolicibacterium vaccae]